MARRSFIWLLTVPLAIAGTQLAHALAYRLAAPDAHVRASELSVSGHDYMAYFPLALAVGTALALLGLTVEVRYAIAFDECGPGVRPRAWSFAALAPMVFSFQEYFERLAHTGTIPWGAGLESTFVVGIALQIPFALASYGLARLLLRAARSLGRLLAGPLRWKLASVTIRRPAFRLAAPRPSGLGLGYGSRGPPSSLVV